MHPDVYRKKIESRIHNYARVNLLSPKQIKMLFKLNYDVDFLEDKVSECLKKPDIKYLSKILVPSLTESMRPNRVKGNVGRAVAIGDIIGSSYEFREHDYNDVNPENLVLESSFFTDDTILSYATIYETCKAPKNPNYRQAYISAYKKYPEAGYASGFIRWAKNIDISNRKGYGSFANGSAMRVAGIGYYYDNIKDVIKNAIKSSMVTHNHQDGIKGAVIVAVVVWMAQNGYLKEDIEKYTARFYHHNDEDMRFLINKRSYFDLYTNLYDVPNIVSQNSIFCNYAVPFAIKCFLETESYKECMAEILRHFGDTDTICAIAGGVCYAYYGDVNLSKEDLMRVNTILARITS